MKKIFNKEAILSLSVAIALSLVIVNISLADTCVSDGKSDSYGTYSESGERCSSCGKNCNWSFENGKLTISAKDGAKNVEPRDLSHGYQPWFDKLQEITNVEVKEGITRIGNSSFTASSLTSISLPSTLKSIGSAAFRETSN